MNNGWMHHITLFAHITQYFCEEFSFFSRKQIIRQFGEMEKKHHLFVI